MNVVRSSAVYLPSSSFSRIFEFPGDPSLTSLIHWYTRHFPHNVNEDTDYDVLI